MVSADVVPHDKLKGAELDAACSKLAGGHYGLLVIDLPTRRNVESDRKPHKQLERLEQCARAGIHAQSFAILLGAWHDSLWRSLPIARMTQLYLQHATRIHWCRLGISAAFASTNTSSTTYLSDRSDKLLSNFPIPALPCCCPEPRISHKHDWRDGGGKQDGEQRAIIQERQNQQLLYLSRLLDHLGSALRKQGGDSVSESQESFKSKSPESHTKSQSLTLADQTAGRDRVPSV